MRHSPRWLRLGIHLAFAALWLTGTAVFALKHFFASSTELGPVANPAAVPLLAVHGIVAVLVTFLFGWIAAAHVGVMWRGGADRASGLWLLWLVAILIVTGFAGFFVVSDSLRDWNGLLHGVLGLTLIAPWLVHIFRCRRAISGIRADRARPAARGRPSPSRATRSYARPGSARAP